VRADEIPTGTKGGSKFPHLCPLRGQNVSGRQIYFRRRAKAGVCLCLSGS
jgi:hypothetical protein